jgi:sugar phosphate isomerase/epimerase
VKATSSAGAAATDWVEQRELALACLAFLDVDPEAHVTAAATAGFDHVTLRVTGSADPVPAEVGHDPRRLARLRATLDESGVGVLDVEVLRMSPGLTTSDVSRTLEAAAVLGARHVLVVNSALERAEATDLLGEIVSLASDSGVRPCLEPMRFSRCRDLREAVATAVPAGAAVLVDVLHLFRSGDGLGAVADALHRYGSGLFPYVQVCDAPAEGPEGDSALRQEAVEARLLPGAGELPLEELVSMLPPGLPLAVEAPTVALRAAAPDVRALAAMTAVQGVLESAGHQAGRLRG